MLKSCKMAKYSEDELLWRHILTRFNKGISQYGLIDDGDNIMVALSGGKDSMALLSLLAEKSRIFKPRFSVVAVHVVMQNVGYKSDIDYLRDFSASLGVPFFHVETSYEYSEQSGKPHCFLCSWNRRKVLFSKAKEMGCNKIALGHHMDDILETLLMNMLFAGSPSPMAPLLKMNKFDMTIIRPMCLIRERDLSRLAEARGFREQTVKCPHERATNRLRMKQLLAEMEQINPEACYSLWRCVDKMLPAGHTADSESDKVF